MIKIENTILDKLTAREKFLIIAHRGVFAGNIIENTIESVKASFISGADIAEIDVLPSKDGVFYLFHDGVELKLFGEKFDIRDLHSEEIDKLKYFNSLRHIKGQSPTRLEDVLNSLQGDELINIDRSWFYWEELLPYLDKFDKAKHILLKSKVDRKLLELLNNHKVKYMYFPIIYSMEELDIVQEYPGINLIGAEMIAFTEDGELFKKESIKEVRSRGLDVIINSEKLDDETDLFGDIHDDNAIINGFDVWDLALEKGVNIIQTDWPWILDGYRKNL